MSWVLNLIHSNNSEHIVIWTLMYPFTPLWQFFCQLSSLTIGYPNLGFNSYSITFFVPMYSSCIPPSHHTVLWNFHCSPFLKTWFFFQCVWCVWCPWHSYPCRHLVFYPIKLEVFVIEPHLDPCSTNHYLESWNVLEPLLYFIFCCIHS